MRVLLPCAAILLVLTNAAADTIVLKNGHRIVADQVSEEETRVVYETALGKFSLAKTLVDHVEHDGARSPAQEAKAPKVQVPSINVGVRPDHVIVDDAVNRKYLDDLARSRPTSTAGKELVVGAFLSAVEFEIAHGRLDAAFDIARQGAVVLPGDARMLMGQAVVYFQRQEYRPARDLLMRAKVLAPESAEVWKLLGFAEYSSDRVADAVASWKKSVSIEPDPVLEKMIERAAREVSAEDRFLEANSNHFTLRFEGGQVSSAFRGEILDTLESLYRSLLVEVGGSADTLPADPITVILYTAQAFYDVTQAPTWTGALFDGKIRVPVEGLSEMTPQLRSVLKHEMTHSFVRARSRARCPAWLNEGLAQLEEGRSISGARQLEDGLRSHPFSLAKLSEPFSTMGVQAASAAYAISLAAVEMLRDQSGIAAIGLLLDRLAAGASIDAAMRESLGYSLDEADARLLDYLRRK